MVVTASHLNWGARRPVSEEREREKLVILHSGN